MRRNCGVFRQCQDASATALSKTCVNSPFLVTPHQVVTQTHQHSHRGQSVHASATVPNRQLNKQDMQTPSPFPRTHHVSRTTMQKKNNHCPNDAIGCGLQGRRGPVHLAPTVPPLCPRTDPVHISSAGDGTPVPSSIGVTTSATCGTD